MATPREDELECGFTTEEIRAKIEARRAEEPSLVKYLDELAADERAELETLAALDQETPVRWTEAGWVFLSSCGEPIGSYALDVAIPVDAEGHLRWLETGEGEAWPEDWTGHVDPAQVFPLAWTEDGWVFLSSCGEPLGRSAT